MARLNQSQFALLGLLSFGPMSGYDLKRLSAWSIGYFWREGYGQIYPTLKKMAAKGLVKKTTETNPGRPDRHIYALTAAGRKELNLWLERSAVTEVPRNELLLKLFFGGLAPASVSEKHVTQHREQCEHRLAAYKAIRNRLEKEAASHPQKPFWLMTLNYGEHMAHAQVKWCDETLKELEDKKQRTKRN
ncbi:MAG TPA: PadR family transcriptional regulator [Silvibacterium sp.]|jgi:DNA-binding PadR family transcriptional regulator|nr:PadR family transcriptional regulator [Silvibacterium sp.]